MREGVSSARRRVSRLTAASLALAALLLLGAACSSGGTKTSGAQTTAPTTTQASQSDLTPTPTVLVIADLATFRATLAAAFTSGKWERVAALMSPAFTFQGTSSGGAQLLMPQASADFKTLFAANLPWTTQDSSLLSLYGCFAGNTPNNQIMLFAGGPNVLAMVGIQRWQDYWVLAWAFQNTRDSSGYCL